MKTLVLTPGQRALRYALFAGRRTQPALTGIADDYRGPAACHIALAHIRQALGGGARRSPAPAVIGVRVPYGGTLFAGPVWLCDAVIRSLETLVPAAPLHLPAVLALLRQCGDAFPGLPVLLAFDTAFFAALPDREAYYALDAELARDHGLRRCGYHGLLHAGACEWAADAARMDGRDPAALRVLSLCLDAQPELAAVRGGQPVYLTSGVTPLEGLPGHTTSGDLDPGLVIRLAEELKCGPERLNALFTCESGLKGLTGRPLTYAELFGAPAERFALARQLVLYRLLQACGMAVAALGGADALVLSGRQLAAGRPIAAWLKRQPLFRPPAGQAPCRVRYFRRTVERLVADLALAWAGLRSAAPRPPMR